MTISIFKSGISITYTCRYLKRLWVKKCSDANTDKCYTCKYCVAEIPAKDVTRLLNSYSKKQINRENLREKSS